MKGCHDCVFFNGENRKGYSNCEGYEVASGFIVRRAYIRPEATTKRPCKRFREGRERGLISPRQAGSYDWHDHMFMKSLKEAWE